MTRPFEKWHGLGNDFLVVVDPAEPEWWHEQAIALCDRHRGVGADGLLIATTDPQSMVVINADGSGSEMCGNGLRCVAAALVARDPALQGRARIQTGAGPRACVVEGEGPVWRVRAEGGRVSSSARDAGVDDPAEGLVLDGEGLQGLVASVGNPHWVFFDHPGAAQLAVYGPRLAGDPRFAARTNVEWVTPVGEARFRVVVWERGVGITKACATGATAVAAALVRKGKASVGSPISLELPGGTLEVVVEADGSTEVRGPAARVYSGVLP